MQALGEGVHVHRVCLAQAAAVMPLAWLALDAEEQARAERISHEIARRRFVLVRAALRILLAERLCIGPQEVRIALGGRGKPRLQGLAADAGLVFNVSHAGESGLIALSCDTALGVDIEQWRTSARLDGIARRCFASGELSAWQRLADADKPSAFFSRWCCKEAFAKATGEGVGLGLAACVVDLSGWPSLLSIPGHCGEPGSWQLATIPTLPGYSAALCYSGEPRRVFIHDLPVFRGGLANVIASTGKTNC